MTTVRNLQEKAKFKTTALLNSKEKAGRYPSQLNSVTEARCSVGLRHGCTRSGTKLSPGIGLRMP